VLTEFYFAPTETARDSLRREGYPDEKIYLTGNTVIDALQWTSRLDPPSEIINLLSSVGDRRLILLTAHRRENFGEPLLEICRAVTEIVESYADVAVVYPVHLNPNVQDVVFEQLGDMDRVFLIEPQSYQAFVHLMKKAYLVLTDSGGIQEEAPALGNPVLVLRKVTERPEAVEAGTVRVIGTGKDDIVRETGKLLENQAIYQKMATAVSPYGDGRAAERIVRVLIEHYHPS
jgi:UDP-N-acetylglucosamine 2-epimerase (non-hydrolysing)